MEQGTIVSKFGGSSLADTTAMKRSARIARKQGSSVIVVSAVYGVTDRLVDLVRAAERGHWKQCQSVLSELKTRHFDLCREIKVDPKTRERIDRLFDELSTLVRGISLLEECSAKAKDQVMSFGERMSSLLFTEVYQSMFPGMESRCIDVRELMITDDRHGRATPDLKEIARRAPELLKVRNDTVYVTQGFIGQTLEEATTTLGRGGSDYSAALIAEALDADVLEIWTDVEGIATTDPHICGEALPIREISYNEASEMAQYGAKILHPATLVPAMRKNIPVFVGSSFDEQAAGTWIRQDVEEKPLIRAITNRNDQALLTIRTPEMLNAVGFMDDIFGVFARHDVSVDCVTTSEISVAISIDRSMMEHEALVRDLERFGEVEFETGKALISLIGNDILSTHGLGKNLFNALGEINVRMVSLGASAHNFNLLVDEADCEVAVRRLHMQFIEKVRHEYRALRHG